MRRRGFTFIELVTVWAIIGILAAILFPVFARAREKARQSSCQSNLANIGVALRIYAADYHGHLPPRDNDLTPLFPRYLADSTVLACPSRLGDPRVIPYPPLQPEAISPHGLAGSYVYRGGFCDDDRPDPVIASDDQPGVHNDGANYLFLTNRVKWVKDLYTNPSSNGSTAWRAEGMDELQALRATKSGKATGQAAPTPPQGGGEQ